VDGWHFLGNNVKQVSGGQMGNAIVLDQNGNASTYDEWSGVLTFLSGGVAHVTTGSGLDEVGDTRPLQNISGCPPADDFGTQV
jgi:hypothetical protein